MRDIIEPRSPPRQNPALFQSESLFLLASIGFFLLLSTLCMLSGRSSRLSNKFGGQGNIYCKDCDRKSVACN